MDELIRELKAEGVLRSPYVEAAFRAIDRKDFVRPESVADAYGNYPLPIGAGQTISQPYTVAFMLDLLDPRPGEKILDVGAGSGWTTALLAHCVSQKGGMQNAKIKMQNYGRVFAVERIAELCRFGKKNVGTYNFVTTGVANFLCQDASTGLPEEAPFDKILAGAAAFDRIPPAWRDQLKVGGAIVAPVGGSVWRYTKVSNTEWQEEEFPGFAFVPLVRGAAEAESVTHRADRNDKGGRRPSFFALGALLLALCAAGAYAAFVPITLGAGRHRVDIREGMGSWAIARELKSQGLIRSPGVFVAYAALTGSASELKAGTYEFSGRIAMPEALRLLVAGGQYPNERVITIPEGWDLRDIGFFFERNGMYQAEELWEIAGFPAADYRNPGDLPAAADFSKAFAFLADKPSAAGLEGYLFPDTYRVFRDAGLVDIIRKMLENFDTQLIPELEREIRRQKKSVFEIVTMASLIEKEVAHPADRAIVAGILWKRLEHGTPLQVDASVNYITGKRESPSAEDLALDSPYNTYRFSGLPLGPIANPGIEAIRAALHPAESHYLYYLSTADGTTIFSRTLEEHNAAKAKYLR